VIAAIERGIEVDADHEHLFRVLLNLARNATQALMTRTPNDPIRDQIRVTGRREGAVVVIEVSDTGPGLPAKAREHLFEAVQGSTRTGGSGLGLAIARELAERMQGRLTVRSAPGSTTFSLVLPG
jgi:signal transduction histidine kinase